MFHPGDIVSYGTNGVCEITEQKRVRLAGQPCDCLILKPVYDQSMTICVPCTSQVLLDRHAPAAHQRGTAGNAPRACPRPRGGRRCPQGAVPQGPAKRRPPSAAADGAGHPRSAPGPQGPGQGAFGPLTTALCTRRRTCCTASSRTFWASSLTPCPVHCGRTGRRIKNDAFLTNIFCHAIFNTRQGIRPCNALQQKEYAA